MKDEADGSNEYNNFQPSALNMIELLIKDLKDIDIVSHIRHLYANGYLSQWDQFTSQVEPLASTVPYMIARYICEFSNWNAKVSDFCFAAIHSLSLQWKP